MSSDSVIAIDVGGTTIKSALVAGSGDDLTVRHSRRHPTGATQGPQAVVETILRVAEGLGDAARADGTIPRAVGVAVPAVIDEAAGVAVWSANLGLRDVPLRDLVSARLGLPAVLGHDVRAGGAAEARLGAGRGARHVLFVAVGTSIAAAHVVDGRVLAGAHGAAGELGHVAVRRNGPPCTCGGRGCLEVVASAAAAQRRYAELGGGEVPADRIAAAVAGGGDDIAARAWREAVDALADGLVLAQALFDPEVVVLGGGLAEAGETLFAPLRTAVKERRTFHREARLVPAALGDRAGCLGAALLARDGAR